MKSIFRAVLWIAVFLGISYLIGEATRANMDWYDTLDKPELTPPKLAFPIVWTTLYVMLAIVGSRLWGRRKDAAHQAPIILFSIYMVMNWAWSFIFFVGHYIGAGFAWIVLSDIILLALILRLSQSKKLDAALLIPTLLWGTFAAYLNGYIYWFH